MEDLANLILLKLNRDFDENVKKPRNNSSGLLLGELVYRIIEDGGKTLPVHKIFPEMGEQTFIRVLRRAFPDVRLNGGNETWYYKLLSFIEHKTCSKCSSVKHYSEFCKDKYNNSGVHCICKLCRKPIQSTAYKNNLSYYKDYLKNNRRAFVFRNAKRRARLLKATPPWADLVKIKEIYKTCPEGFHVDHVYPLISDWVCGLHVENNLRAIPAKDNLAKGNRAVEKLVNS